jgi:predicted PurR-regulated permease PerM
LNRNLKFVLGLVGAVVLLYLVWYFRSIVAYAGIATAISFIGEPIVRLIRRITIGNWRVPSSLAALITLSFFVFVIIGLGWLFAPLIATQAQTLSQIDFKLVEEYVTKRFANILAFLETYNLSGDARSNEQYLIAHLQNLVKLGDITVLLNNFVGILSTTVVAIFSILFMSFFFLRDAHMVGRIIRAATPDKYLEQTSNILERTRRLLTRYFSGLLAQITLVTLLITLGLSIFGVENFFLIGFLAGLLNLIPYLGPLIGAAIGIFIAVTTSPELATGDVSGIALKTAAVFAVVQLLDNIVFQPIIFSNSVNAHPLEIFIVISLAGSLAGISGMILAIPGYTLFRIIAKEFLSGFKIIQSITRNLDRE